MQSHTCRMCALLKDETNAQEGQKEFRNQRAEALLTLHTYDKNTLEHTN